MLFRKPNQAKEQKPTIGDLSEKGLVVDYKKLRHAINKCEVEMHENKANQQCREALKDLGIKIYE